MLRLLWNRTTIECLRSRGDFLRRVDRHGAPCEQLAVTFEMGRHAIRFWDMRKARQCLERSIETSKKIPVCMAEKKPDHLYTSNLHAT